VIRNAIVTGSTGHAIEATGATGVDVDYLMTFGNGGNACQGCAAGSNSLASDPRYLDAAASDFRLSADSPAIDAGVALGLDVSGDAPGLFNGSAPDLGAFEH
jgi:hypothetical protein